MTERIGKLGGQRPEEAHSAHFPPTTRCQMAQEKRVRDSGELYGSIGERESKKKIASTIGMSTGRSNREPPQVAWTK